MEEAHFGRWRKSSFDIEGGARVTRGRSHPELRSVRPPKTLTSPIRKPKQLSYNTHGTNALLLARKAPAWLRVGRAR